MKDRRIRVFPEYDNSQIIAIINEKIHSKRDRNVLHLKLVDDLSFTQIADKLNMPMSTVTLSYYKNIDAVLEMFNESVPRQ